MFRQGLNSDGEILRSAYVEHDPVDLDASHDGCCRQEFADECDINVLMATYEKTGVLNHFNKGTPQYLDVSAVPDLRTALQVLGDAEAAFMSLPAAVRREFDNDALKFIEYAENPENLGRMREWGLAPPEKVPDAPVRVEVTNPAPAPGEPS